MIWRGFRRPKFTVSIDGLMAGLVGLSSFLFYLPFLPQTVSFEDSAEFVTAAATMGITHPSGSPLYVLLAQPFVHLPFGTMPWRVALFSAVCAAATVGLAYLIAASVIKSSRITFGWFGRLTVAALCLQLTVAETWWAQAVYAKNYPLLALLLAASIYALIRAAEAPDSRVWPRLAALFLGLAAANHLFLTIVVAPFFLTSFMAVRPAIFRKPLEALPFLAYFLLGLTPYLFLLFRPAFGDYYAAGGRISSVGDVARYVLRTNFDDFGTAGWNKLGLVIDSLARVARELGPLAVLFAAVGAWRLVARGGRAGLALTMASLGLVSAAPLIIVLRSGAWAGVFSYVYRIFSLPGYVAIAVLAAVGAVWLSEKLLDGSRARGRIVAVIALMFLPLLTIWQGLPTIVTVTDPFADQYVRAVLGGLPPRSVLVVQDVALAADSELFIIAYLQQVEGFRRDVTIVHDTAMTVFDDAPILPEKYYRKTISERRALLLKAALQDRRFAGRPLYATFPAEAASQAAAPGSALAGLQFRSNGLVFHVLRPNRRPAAQCPPPSEPQPTVDDFGEQLWLPPVPRLARPDRDYGLSYLAAHALYNYAASLEDFGGPGASRDALAEALSFDPQPMSDDYVAAMAHRAAASRAVTP